MKTMSLFLTTATLFSVCACTYAEESSELQQNNNKAAQELPKILYMVPWQETKTDTKKEQQKLVLHSLFGDLFEPTLPDQLAPPTSIADE